MRRSRMANITRVGVIITKSIFMHMVLGKRILLTKNEFRSKLVPPTGHFESALYVGFFGMQASHI